MPADAFIACDMVGGGSDGDDTPDHVTSRRQYGQPHPLVADRRDDRTYRDTALLSAGTASSDAASRESTATRAPGAAKR